MEFDPAASAEFIPEMIKNDTLIEVLDEYQLCECLKHITLTFDESIYVLKQVQSKYKLSERFNIIRHLYAEFGDEENFDSNGFIEFLKAFGRCLHCDVIHLLADVAKTFLDKNEQLRKEIESLTLALKNQHKQPKIQTQVPQNSVNRNTSQPVFTNLNQNHAPPKPTKLVFPPNYVQGSNKNIEEMKKLSKSMINFDRIYSIFKKIAKDNDTDAMTFGLQNSYCYATNRVGCNVLIQAAQDNNFTLARYLIENGVDYTLRDNSGNDAFIVFCSKGNLDAVIFFLSLEKVDVNSADNDNWTALMLASQDGHTDVVIQLLNVSGIDVNAQNKLKWTALMLASQNGHIQIVEQLLNRLDINVNARDSYNNTALLFAAQNGREAVVRALIKAKGIDLNARDIYNNTALSLASMKGYNTIARMLQLSGAI